jgi:hypothetical protein
MNCFRFCAAVGLGKGGSFYLALFISITKHVFVSLPFMHGFSISGLRVHRGASCDLTNSHWDARTNMFSAPFANEPAIGCIPSSVELPPGYAFDAKSKLYRSNDDPNMFYEPATDSYYNSANDAWFEPGASDWVTPEVGGTFAVVESQRNIESVPHEGGINQYREFVGEECLNLESQVSGKVPDPPENSFLRSGEMALVAPMVISSMTVQNLESGTETVHDKEARLFITGERIVVVRAFSRTVSSTEMLVDPHPKKWYEYIFGRIHDHSKKHDGEAAAAPPEGVTPTPPAVAASQAAALAAQRQQAIQDHPRTLITAERTTELSFFSIPLRAVFAVAVVSSIGGKLTSQTQLRWMWIFPGIAFFATLIVICGCLLHYYRERAQGKQPSEDLYYALGIIMGIIDVGLVAAFCLKRRRVLGRMSTRKDLAALLAVSICVVGGVMIGMRENADTMLTTGIIGFAVVLAVFVLFYVYQNIFYFPLEEMSAQKDLMITAIDMNTLRPSRITFKLGGITSNAVSEQKRLIDVVKVISHYAPAIQKQVCVSLSPLHSFGVNV